MPSIRHVRIHGFRGYDDFAFAVYGNAVVVGEPGAGRSDLVEALVRVMDPNWSPTARPSDLDLFGLSEDRSALVEVVLGDLPDDVRSALFTHLEFWDRENESIISELEADEMPETGRFEWIVRFGYRLAIRDGIVEEISYYPKSSDPSIDSFDRLRAGERALVPFYWQRGLTTKPLDLAGRGEFRNLVDQQQGEEFKVAIDRFMEKVSAAAAEFSAQERVAAALERVLEPLRAVRRFDPTAAGAELIRFLPDGGAPSGLLRSLSSAISLLDSPEYLPAIRQGATVLAALRGGAVGAVSAAASGAIVVIDDFGGEFDPFLARHLVRELRRSAGQVLVTTHSSSVAGAFGPEEIVRLHFHAGARRAATGRRATTREERISIRYQSSALLEALNSSAVVIVEGHHDRLAYSALADRATSIGSLASFDAAGICFAEAEGDGAAAKVARAAKELGIFTVVILDNDDGSPAAGDAEVQECLSAADAVVRLPNRTALEAFLIDDLEDEVLVRAFGELSLVFGDLGLPGGWNEQTGNELRRTLYRVMKRPGSLHASLLLALRDNELPAGAIKALETVRSIVQEGRLGLEEL